jgi:CUB domain
MGAKITCPSNYIEIIHTTADGVEHTLRYCGEDTPEKFRASTNVVTVRYKKSVHFSGTGWIIHFIAVHQGKSLF